MKTLFPDTLAFRTTALLVIGLAVTHFISNLFYTTDRETALLSAGGEHAIQWIATTGAFSDTISSEAWGEVVARSNTDTRFVAVTETPLVSGESKGGWREEALERELARHVSPDHLDDYRIAYAPLKNLAAAPMDIRGYFAASNSPPPSEFILLSLDLGNDRWLNMAAPVQASAPFFSARLGLSMAVMLVAVVGISALLVGRMTDPLKQVSKAAEQLGTDVQAPAIPETGPEEVRRTAHAFNVMQNRIRRYVEDRTQMLAAIAHDLGTPITRLRLRAEFVEDKIVRRKMLRDLDDMQQMVASTLSFIREDATSEPQATVDIGSLLARVCDDNVDAGHDVELEEMPRWVLVNCRPVALRRAVGNMIDNAVKYGHSARVSLELGEETLRILIKDSGPGIPENRFEDVFRPFLRLEDSRNRETGGTGLGLSVARTIVRGHGGDITLSNSAGGGLCVAIKLPRAKGATGQKPAKPAARDGAGDAAAPQPGS